MTPDDHTAAIRSLQSDVADIKGTLNNGLRAMVQEPRRVSSPASKATSS